MDDLRVPPGPGNPRGLTVPAGELFEQFSHASGPGVRASGSHVRGGNSFVHFCGIMEQTHQAL